MEHHLQKYFFLLVTFVFGTGMTFAQDFSPVKPGNDGVPDANWPSVSFRTFDNVAISAGITPLRDKELTEKEQEIRVWIGGGITAPEFLYRIIKKDHSVHGELVLYWKDSEPSKRPEGETVHDLIIYYNAGRCERFTLKSGVGTCKALFTEQPDWGDIFYKVIEAGIWDLPDASIYDEEPEILEDGSVVMNLETDGWSMTAELRKGDLYRTYQYGNPQNKSWPEAEKILEIHTYLNEIASKMKSADVTDNYRGITTGKYRAAFKVCNSNEVWAFRAAGSIEYFSKRVELELPEPGNYGYEVEVYGTPTPTWLAKKWESEFIRELQIKKLISIEPAVKPTCK